MDSKSSTWQGFRICHTKSLSGKSELKCRSDKTSRICRARTRLRSAKRAHAGEVMHTKKLQRITNTAAGPRLATASTPRAIHPRHCRSAASARLEEVAQARDTAGQCRSTRKARRSRLPHAAVCAHARMCFWDNTHLHACFHSPKSAMGARKNLVGMLNPGTARTPSHPIEFKKSTTRAAATARWTLGRKNQLAPQTNRIAPRRGISAATSSRTRREPPHPNGPGTRVHRIEP